MIKRSRKDVTFLKQQQGYTEQEYNMAMYYLRDPVCKGNAYLSYQKAYPNQGERGAMGHSSQKLASAGVQAAVKAIKDMWAMETVMRAYDNEEEGTVEEALRLLTAMWRNKPHEVTGDTPFRESTQRWALETFLEMHGLIGKKDTVNDNGITNIQINVNPDEKKEAIETSYILQGELTDGTDDDEPTEM